MNRLIASLSSARLLMPALLLLGVAACVAVVALATPDSAAERAMTSFSEVVDDVGLQQVRAAMRRAKAGLARRHQTLLNNRYDLRDMRRSGARMSRGKPIQRGVRIKPKAGVSLTALAEMRPSAIRERDLFPAGFMPLPHPHHDEGGMVFPGFHLEELERQTGRDLTRFDLDFDLPDHFLPEFPPPIYLTTRPDLGDASRGQLVTIANYYALFDGVLNPKQLDGLRLLVTPFPQQQFNATDDRRSDKPSLGVSCFDCHANGHTNGATHLVGDVRPQRFRHRVDTPTLRGVNVQRLFGSQRALKTVEDFTEFEQRAAYFDGDPVIAASKGVNVLERGSQVHAMAEVQAILDFPPAPKLDVFGHLSSASASASELRGEALFYGKARCSSCHPAPHFTDNTMHDLKVERFFKARDIEGRYASADGPIKTFPLRGIKDSPPYLHDGRLLTLDDTVAFFNVVLGLQLTDDEQEDLIAFLLTL